MDKKTLEITRYRNWCAYHLPGSSCIKRIKKNAVFISAANSLEHELKKTEICWRLRKEGKEFITEAVDNKTDLRRDVVCLDDGIVWEVETDEKRARRHGKDIKVVMVG